MKGVIFTTDAVFALLITIMSISILLFFTYYTQTPFAVHYADAQALLSNLASGSVASLQNSSPIAMGIQKQFIGANETWPQYLGGPQRNSSGQVGPLEPIFLYTYNPGNTITTSIVADYGNIYFAANSIVYAVNATSNRTAWTLNTITNVAATPALYSGTLIFTNSTNLTAVSARTGARMWTTGISSKLPSNTPLLVYDNKVLFSNGVWVYAYYATNGTPAWSNYTVSPPVSIEESGGTIEVGTTTAGTAVTNIASLVQSGRNGRLFTNTIVPSSTGIAGQSAQVYFGQTSSPYTLNSVYANGTVASGFPLTTTQSLTGVAVYKRYVIYQTVNGVIALPIAGGAPYWSYAMPFSFGTISAGTPLANATPLVTGTTVYTLWPNGLAAQNLTTGSIKWFALMPGAATSPQMTLAYGKLYVTANNIVRVYGSCDSPLYGTLLSAASTMAWNSQGGCASALLTSVYPAYNYSFFVGNPVPFKVTYATFNALSKSYIIAHNSGALNNSYVSATFWLNVSSYPLNGARVVNYGDSGKCKWPGGSPYNECGWFFTLLGNGELQFSVVPNTQTYSATTSFALSKNKWYMATGVYDGNTIYLYLNSNTAATKSIAGTMLPTTPNINLTIGGSPCCSPTYLNGNVANLQVYGKPYGIQQVAQLYREGVRGVPLKGEGLVAWYPLAGDPNDYALFNPGYISGNVNFATSGYISPALSNAYGISKASILLPVLNYSTGVWNTINVGVYSWD